MEGSDAFGTEISGGEDPFAGGTEDWSGFGSEEKAEATATEEVKTVDREGNEVASDTRTELERKEDAYQYATGHDEPVSEDLRDAHEQFEREKAQGAQDAEFEAAAPTDAERAEEVSPDENERLRAIADRERQEAAQAAEHNEQQAVADASEAAQAAERAQEEVQAAEAERETAEAPQEGAEEPEAPAPAPEGATEPEAAAEEPAAAPEPQSEEGSTKRRYYVLQMTERGKFEQITWYEDAKGKMVPKGTAGAKRQGIALVRGTEQALRIGHAALGSPDGPVQLVAVSALHFQPRTVAPEQPDPPKRRLRIG